MGTSSKLKQKLILLQGQKFTGNLQVVADDAKQWHVYFYQGILVWAEGGTHVYRFWQRHLIHLCSPQDISLFEKEHKIGMSSTDYYFIRTLLRKHLAPRPRVKLLAQQRILTVLFDLLQIESKQGIDLKTISMSNHVFLKYDFNLTISNFVPVQLVQMAEQSWLEWQGKGLSSCSPNLAPVLKSDTNLEQQVSTIIFQNMKRTLNGKNTLRDLELKMDKPVFELTCALIPYFFKGYIRLIEIPDITELRPTTLSSK